MMDAMKSQNEQLLLRIQELEKLEENRSESSESLQTISPVDDSLNVQESICRVEIPVQKNQRKVIVYVDMSRSGKEVDELIHQIDEYENEVLLYQMNSEIMMKEVNRLRQELRTRPDSELREKMNQMEKEMENLRNFAHEKDEEVKKLTARLREPIKEEEEMKALKKKVHRLEVLQEELNEHLNEKEKALKACYKSLNRTNTPKHS